jgi:23S rRNA (cytidine1920-2'-O)/16S rRNA (cytidine1409-2'-O)-methyltransferase
VFSSVPAIHRKLSKPGYLHPENQKELTTKTPFTMSAKQRVDKLVYEKGLAPSRERAQAYVMAGKVLVNERKIDKPGQKVALDSAIRLLGSDQPYVSRGGLKLAEAVQNFEIEVRNKMAMDIGASTGGFTDFLLQHKATYVFAIDSGYNQLSWQLVTNPKVKNLEKTNFRHLTMEEIGTYVDLIVIDVSFISLKKILGNCMNFLVAGGHLVALIKPQFEAGRSRVGKGGVVNSPEIHQEIIRSIENYAESVGFIPSKVIPSPIYGKKSGNQEFLIHLTKPSF